MFFPFTGVEISLIYLILLGFIVGFLGGFFGIGGGSIFVPLLFFAGVPMPIAIGTSLAFIAGKSVVGMFTHLNLGNVDYKLGFVMTIGVLPGTELGALFIEYLKAEFHEDVVNEIIIVAYILLLLIIALVVFSESILSIKTQNSSGIEDFIAFQWISKLVLRFPIGPKISIKNTDHRASIWMIIGLGFLTGLLSGFLGVGGGFVRVPILVYFLGVPTTIAIGTDLMEIIFSAGFGTLTHSVKGNVDLLIALITSLWGCIGAFIGALLTKYFSGNKIRLLYVSIPVISIILLVIQII
jgi:uncharacterized membrane protein YfcA